MRTKPFLRIERTEHTHSEDYVRSEFGRVNHIGGGCFANVYEHPTDSTKVIKVTVGYDRAYIRYIKHVRRLRVHSPWLPRVHDAFMVMSAPILRENYEARSEWFKGHGARRGAVWFVAILDKLTSFDDEDRNRDMWRIYNELALAAGEIRWGRKTVGLTELMDRQGLKPSRKDLVAEALLNRMIKKYKLAPDMHCLNAMWHGQQLVLTDPFCG